MHYNRYAIINHTTTVDWNGFMPDNINLEDPAALL